MNRVDTLNSSGPAPMSSFALPQAPSGARGALLALVAAVLFACVGVLSTLAFDAGANVVSLLSVRYLICAVLLWAVARVLRLRMPPLRDAVLVFGLGMVLFAAQSTLYFSALTRVHPGVADMLMFVYPALVTVGAIALRRERADRRRVAALVTAVAGIGVVLVASASAGVDPLGAAFALAAALGYACYLLVTESVVRRTHPIVLTALLTSGAGSAFTAAGLTGVGGGLDLRLSPVVWLLIVVIAIAGTVLPYLGFTLATRAVGPSTASIVATAQVPCSTALSAVVLGVAPTGAQLVGGGLVICAVGILQAQVVPVRWRRRLLAPTRAATAIRGRVERALPERRPDRGLPVRRGAARVRRTARATAKVASRNARSRR